MLALVMRTWEALFTVISLLLGFSVLAGNFITTDPSLHVLRRPRLSRQLAAARNKHVASRSIFFVWLTSRLTARLHMVQAWFRSVMGLDTGAVVPHVEMARVFVDVSLFADF